MKIVIHFMRITVLAGFIVCHPMYASEHQEMDNLAANRASLSTTSNNQLNNERDIVELLSGVSLYDKHILVEKKGWGQESTVNFIVYKFQNGLHYLECSDLDFQKTGEATYGASPEFIVSISSTHQQTNINILREEYTFILDYSGYEIGNKDKDFLLKSKGQVIVKNRLRASKIDIVANTISFEDQIEADQIQIKAKHINFLVPHLHPANSSLLDEGFILFSSYSYKPSERISWENYRQSFPLLRLGMDIYNIIYQNSPEKNNNLCIPNDNNLNFLLESFTTNKDKGKVAEKVVKAYFLNQNYSSHKTKLAKVNGFDGLFVKGEEYYIVETKFTSSGQLVPGTKCVYGHSWKQLSTPYNKDTLKEMILHSNNNVKLNRSCQIIKRNIYNIKLKFCVLNKCNKSLDIYDVGTFLKSYVD